MAKGHGAEHDVLGQFAGLRFDHQHAVLGARDDEVEDAVDALVGSRVKHVLTVDVADACAADGAEERQARERQRGRRADHRDHVGVVLEVVRQHRADDLGLVLEALGEERPDGPVDEARDERFLLARAPLALEEAARDLARGRGLLLVVDGEREKVEADPWLALRDRGAQHHRLAIARQDGAVGLARDAPGLERQRPPAP